MEVRAFLTNSSETIKIDFLLAGCCPEGRAEFGHGKADG
jgi:hypothetical protein